MKNNRHLGFVSKIRTAISKKYPDLSPEKVDEIIDKFGNEISELISDDENVLALVKFDENGNPDRKSVV